MTRARTVNELIQHVGADLGESTPRLISQTTIDQFAELTGDRQWIHVDPQRAAVDSPYECTIAHGALVLALVPVFVLELLRIADARTVINIGLDRTRFRRPVPVNSRVSASGNLVGAEPAWGGVLVRVRVSVRNDADQRAVCTTDQRILIHA